MIGTFDLTPTLPAHDLDRARRWYEEKLGLTPESEGPDGLTYRSGSTTFLVYPSQFAGTAQHTQAGWDVDDIATTMDDLRSRGVTFEEYDLPGLKTENGVATFGESGEERAAWFKDSEGNILALTQRSR